MLRKSILVLATAVAVGNPPDRRLAAVSRKTILVLAIALTFGSSELSTTALARSGGDGGRWSGSLGFRGDPFAGGFAGRTAGGDFASYGGRVGGSHGGLQGSELRDVWGHWGAYYGPMIH
jgi:hypothetical protein